MTLCQQFLDQEAIDEESETIPRYSFVPIPEEGKKNLKCLQLQQEFLDKANGYDKEKRKRLARYPGVPWFESMPPRSKPRFGVTEQELLVVVRLYRPIKKDHHGFQTNLSNLKYLQELYILGSNYLSELRDLIKCPTDLMTGCDVSDDPPWVKKEDKKTNKFALKVIPATKPRQTLKEKYRSGFFYIEGCFYNDMRSDTLHNLRYIS